jgi:uncharacterized repeat protein (TIGR01451 family)
MSAADPTPVTVTAGAAHLDKAIKAPGGFNYAIGESVTYRISFAFGQGTASDVHIIDALPTGLAYSSVALSTSNVQRPGGGTAALVEGPSAGATGSLDFSLGDLQSTAANPGGVCGCYSPRAEHPGQYRRVYAYQQRARRDRKFYRWGSLHPYGELADYHSC